MAKKQDGGTTQYISTQEAAKMINDIFGCVSHDMMRQWRMDGNGPVWVKVSEGKRGRVRYLRKTIIEYIKEREKPQSK